MSDVDEFLKRCSQIKSEILSHLTDTSESKRSLSLRSGLQADFIVAFLARDDWKTTKNAPQILAAIDGWTKPQQAEDAA